MDNLEKPLTNFTVVRASKESMIQVASILRLAKIASWTVNVSQQPMESFLGGQDIMNHPPEKSIVTRF